MYCSPVRPDWIQVSIQAFEEFLKECPDYTRNGFSGCVAYEFRHNHHRFAEVRMKEGEEVVYVHPDLLTKQAYA